MELALLLSFFWRSKTALLLGLKNDHKEVMLQIEEALHAVHAEAIAEKEAREAEKNAQSQENTASSSSGSSAPATTAAQEADKDLLPFARVNGVAPDSPAKEAVKFDRLEETENTSTENSFDH